MATPHNRAEKGQFARTVLMPGDPLRAKFIAENYLENAELVTDVRNIYGYTGYYKGKRVSVMASGMGMPSVGIYSYELFKFYDVENIIRIGSAGSYFPETVKLGDTLLCTAAYTESTFANTQNGETRDTLPSSEELNDRIRKAAKDNNILLHEGTIHSGDVFYRANSDFIQKDIDHGCLGSEMESFALFHYANVLGKKAACLVTITDDMFDPTQTMTSEQRQTSLTNMMTLALEAAEE